MATKTNEITSAIKTLAKTYNASVDMRGVVASVTICFQAGDAAAYAKAEAFEIIDLIAARGGSVWGTTSDSVGGYVGMKEGRMVLNKSGVAKRVAAALASV